MFRSCVKVEVAVLGSPSLIILMVCVDVKQHLKKFRSCVKVEVAVLASSFLIILMPLKKFLVPNESLRSLWT